jgi:tetratricopeptide (TPR) repeat protein
MKKIIFTIFIISAGILSVSAQTNVKSLKNAWMNYSSGLYYKTLAGNNPSDLQSFVYIDIAISNFNEALKFGEYLDGVYIQLSECYFMKYEYNKSLEYAEKALKINPISLKPYNKIYNIHMRNKDYPLAAKILEDYMAVQPDAIHVQFVLSEHYYRILQNNVKAALAFKKVIDIYAKIAAEDYYAESAYYFLGYISYASRKPSDAVKYFSKAIEINKSNLDALYMLAVANMDIFKFNEAEIQALTYLKFNPSNVRVKGIIGRIKYIRGAPDAITYLRSAKNDGSVDGILARGLYNELMQNDGESERILKAVIKTAADLVSPRIAMSRIYERKGDSSVAFNELYTAGGILFNGKAYDDARSLFFQASKIKSDIPEVFYFLGRVYEETGNIYLAIHYFKKANSIKNDLDLMIHIGYLYGVKKDYASAVNYFDNASSRDPNNSKPYFYKGLINIWNDDYNIAEVNIKKAIDLENTSESYYFYLAIVQEKKKKIDEAVDSLEKAIKANPLSARAYNYLGYLYADKNIKIDESYTLIKKALELEPENGAFLDSLGWVYYRKGEFTTALEKLLEAEKKLKTDGTPDPVVYDHIGDTYEKLGKIENAVNFWKESLKIGKNPDVEKKVIKFGGKLK